MIRKKCNYFTEGYPLQPKNRRETKMNTSRKKKKARRLFYLIGGTILDVGMYYLMPEIIKRGSNFLYKKKPVKPQREDEWGPEIVEKKASVGGQKNGEL